MPKTHHEKRLGTGDAVSLTVGTMVGAGIFSVFGLTVKTAGLASGFSWILIVILSLPMAYTFSDLTGANQESGGPYVYLRNKHQGLGLFAAWLFLLSSLGAAAGLYMSLIGMMAQFGLTHNQAWLGGTIVLAILTVVVVRGIHLSARVSRWFTAITVCILCLAVFIGFTHFHLAAELAGVDAQSETQNLQLADGLKASVNIWFPHGFKSMLTATFYAFWTYSGWEAVSVPSGSYQSSRQLARGMMIGSIVVGILYILVAWAAIVSVPTLRLESVMNPIAFVGSLLGRPTQLLIEMGTLIIVSGSLMSWLIASAGLFQAAARERLFPAPVAVQNENGEYHWSVPVLCFGLLIIIGRTPIFTAAISVSSLTALFAYAAVFSTVMLDKNGSWQGVIQSHKRRQWLAFSSLFVSLLLIVFSGWSQLWPSLVLGLIGLVFVSWNVSSRARRR